MPTTEWLNKYEAIKDKLTCKDDLEAHFTEKVIGNMAVDVLDIGAVHFPTGQIFACDPLVELEDTLPFLQTIPAGTYPVKICVVPSEQYGDRYACVKVEVSQEKPVRYELGMVGNEDLDEELGEDEYFGFGVDAGMGCVADIQTQAAFKTYWAKRLEEDPDIDPYNDLFCDLMEENAKAHPKYQGDCGDWLNWTVPDTDCNLPIFASGWGDGYYSMRLRWFEDMDEDENRPYDMEEPNFFGLSIAYDPYMREVVQADRLTTCGGDGGCNICGGLGPFLGFLPCSPHCKPEVQEDNELNGDYDFYRPTIRPWQR